MLYGDLTTRLAILARQYDALGLYTFVNSPNFTAYLPAIIEYGENRVYQEVVPLATRMSNSTAKVQAGLRSLPMAFFNPQPVVLEGLSLITPVNTAPQNGTRWGYEFTTVDFIDMFWPQENQTLAPSATTERFWALLDAQTIIIAPTADQAYTAEATGTFRPTPLSATFPVTYLSLFYPALFTAACMIAVAGFQRDYGAQSSDPGKAVSWEGVYQGLLKPALEEEERRRGAGQSWGIGWTPPQTAQSRDP